MKKTISICISTLFLFSLLALPAISLDNQEEELKKSDPKALKILEKMIEAMGGRKTVENVKDSTVSGSMELITMGMEGAVSVYSKEPNKMRIDVEVMGMTIIQAFDGETAWFINPQTGSNEEMAGAQAEDFKRQALGQEIFLHPEKYGIIYIYKGSEKIEDKDHHILVQTHPDGWEATLYIDSETNLTTKTLAKGTDMMGVEVDTETITSDYKKIDGVMVAFSITSYQDGEEFMTMIIDEVKFNTGIEDSFFMKEE